MFSYIHLSLTGTPNLWCQTLPEHTLSATHFHLFSATCSVALTNHAAAGCTSTWRSENPKPPPSAPSLPPQPTMIIRATHKPTGLLMFLHILTGPGAAADTPPARCADQGNTKYTLYTVSSCAASRRLAGVALTTRRCRARYAAARCRPGVY